MTAQISSPVPARCTSEDTRYRIGRMPSSRGPNESYREAVSRLSTRLNSVASRSRPQPDIPSVAARPMCRRFIPMRTMPTTRTRAIRMPGRRLVSTDTDTELMGRLQPEGDSGDVTGIRAVLPPRG
ncbi:hypothetical protein DMB42_30885 [Nonomuraea sp. WAC 01424]|nr:hypothetical protein DMB42_30885 [Nonomuraea sp. WAC 01424]